jgi:cleavage and polyadenylation specificity factor subunit 1
LEARHFIIFTDHKPLVYAFNQKREKCSPRQFNHLDYISQCTTDIRHTSGKDNIVADALFRVQTITTPVTTDVLAVSQEKDEELHTLLERDTALRLEKTHVTGTTVTLYCDKSAGKPRPYVPAPLRRQVFDSLHGQRQQQTYQITTH